MARIVHGFHMTRRTRYHIPVIGIGVVVVGIALYGMMATQSVVVHELLTGLALSLYRIFLAYLFSLALALLIAIPTSQSRYGDVLIPIFDLLQNLPSFALIPLFVYLFGYTNLMVVIFAATSILWPILFYVLHALKTAKVELNDAATMFGAVGGKRDVYYLLPLSFSAAVTGSIVGFSIGWEAIIGVEIIGLTTGIGVFLNNTLAQDKGIFTLGLGALLLAVFIINRLIWMPLLRRSQLYSE